MDSKFMLAHRGGLGVLDSCDMVGEDKYDGSRNQAIKTPTSLEMWSRDSSTNQYRVNYAEVHNIPEVEADLNRLKCKSCWLDMELVWFNKKGRSIFRGSQVRCGSSTHSAVREKMQMYPINGMVFDLLELNGQEFINEPYIYRKLALKEFLDQQEGLTALRYVPYTDDKPLLWQTILNTGGEGIMAKTLKGTYEFRRSREWLKLKNEHLTDGKQGRPNPMQIVGYTQGERARSRYFGSLVMQNEDGSYGGNVGGGFDNEELEKWTEVLTLAPRMDKPFPDEVVGDSYVAVKVPLRVIVRYYEQTTNGCLRFPVYFGIEGKKE